MDLPISQKERQDQESADRHNESYRDWMRHEFSARQLAHVRNALGPALASLIGACRDSSDARVQRALARFEQLDSMRRLLEGQKP